MAAMKTLLMEILDDLNLDDGYDASGQLLPAVQAEYDRRIAEAASDG